MVEDILLPRSRAFLDAKETIDAHYPYLLSGYQECVQELSAFLNKKNNIDESKKFFSDIERKINSSGSTVDLEMKLLNELRIVRNEYIKNLFAIQKNNLPQPKFFNTVYSEASHLLEKIGKNEEKKLNSCCIIL